MSLFLRQLNIPTAEIEGELLVDARNTSLDEYDVACRWLKNSENAEIWKAWTSNTYTPPTREDWEFSDSLKIGIYFVATFSLVLILTVMALFMAYRTHPVLKAISMTFSTIALIGLLLSIIGSFFLVSDSPTSGVCAAQLWLPTVGYSMTLSALGAKTYRIYKIFTSKIKGSQELSDQGLLKYAVVPVFVVILALVVYMAMAAPEPTTTVISEGDTETTYHHCSFSKDFFYTIVCILAALVFCSTKLAYDVREAPERFNEAKELGVSLYTMVLSGLVGVPLIAWMQSQEEFVGFYVTVCLLEVQNFHKYAYTYAHIDASRLDIRNTFVFEMLILLTISNGESASLL
mmetsp:Transcript_27748/g.48995  ORF Transcript_27748/g.48995 Transcript_27748/m.48995 type:complete len:346 (+) Transcript_27748:1193-2230(+)